MTTATENAGTLLTNFYATVFQPLALRSRAPNTLRLYESTLRTFARFLNRQPTLADLNDDTVSRFLDWFKRIGRSPSSVNKERNNLLAIWRFACRKGLIAVWPDVKPERVPKHAPQAWLDDELAKLLAACKLAPGRIGKIPARHWWTALHLVMWNSGERIGALLAVTWDHVDLKRGWLRVPAEVRKCGLEDRLYRLLPETVAALRAVYRNGSGLVFPWPRARTYLWYRYGLLLKRAGLPHDRKSKFHRMRKSVASHAEAAGGNATELLGHYNRKTTLAYLDPRLTGGKFAADILPPMGGSEPSESEPSAEVEKLFRRYCAESLVPRVSDERHLRRSISAIEGCIQSGIQSIADVTPGSFAEHLQRLQGSVSPEGFQRHRAAIGQFLRWLDDLALCPGAGEALGVLGIKTHRSTIGGAV